ncbi:Protein disulfide-isomerase A6 [Camponotus floridanus]|uniref:protein disulfide-isomerase n=1 Tax=Camponotus floridanus TaxID=104421 RepID=E2AZ08_CAMFO|nr:protein disulfide-isomerase A6 homolog [Camponotus floridanus]EFN61326.1 Protein disulfide-isomerase A6 [Camponotus floridanus]
MSRVVCEVYSKMLGLLGFLLLVSGANCLYSSNSAVIDLRPNNFDNLVLNSDHIWVVEFYAPWCGHCQQLTPEYEKAANALKGIVKVGAVNADEHKSLGGKYGVRGFPTIKIFGLDSKPEDFNGPRSAAGIVDAALNAASKKARRALSGKKADSDSKSSDPKDVIELTDENFDKTVLNSEDMWLVEFYAPWCGHCKNLAPEWAAAATQLKGKVKLGALDATVNTLKASKYEIKGYPTIKYFAPGKKDADSVQEYDGGRTSGDIVNWALEKLAENIPAPEVIQITSEKSLRNACEDKPICVVSVLPHILDCQSDCRNGYLKILNDLGEKYKKKMWGWVWSEAGAQSNIEDALEIGGFGYPALAAVNIKKMKYSLLKGSFSYDGINEFLRDLSYGRGGTAPLKGAQLPVIFETAAWDGKDAEPPQEEDIDLSDVDLDEKEEL